jgi:hypothetical protein
MLLTVLVLLVVLWLFGYIHIPNLTIPDVTLFAINGHWVTLVEMLIFAISLLAVGMLPTPLRQIGYAIVVLWVLSTLGVIAVAGLASILVLAIIVGLIAAVIGGLNSPNARAA